jgi:hypothetical protein
MFLQPLPEDVEASLAKEIDKDAFLFGMFISFEKGEVEGDEVFEKLRCYWKPKVDNPFLYYDIGLFVELRRRARIVLGSASLRCLSTGQARVMATFHPGLGTIERRAVPSKAPLSRAPCSASLRP